MGTKQCPFPIRFNCQALTTGENCLSSKLKNSRCGQNHWDRQPSCSGQGLCLSPAAAAAPRETGLLCCSLPGTVAFMACMVRAHCPLPPLGDLQRFTFTITVHRVLRRNRTETAELQDDVGAMTRRCAKYRDGGCHNQTANRRLRNEGTVAHSSMWLWQASPFSPFLLLC
ncbi:hypothetical protein LEMLEM_LOCUS13233 [Lemmus lemmus]